MLRAWRSDDRLAQANVVGAAVFGAAALAFAVRGDASAAGVALATGVAANAGLAGLWRRVPAALGRRAHETWCAWAAVALWQTGTLGVVMALAWPTGSPVPGVIAGAALVASGFLAIDHFGSTVVRHRTSGARRLWRAAPFLVVAGVAMPLGALFVTLAFWAEAAVFLRALAAGVLVAGFAAPAFAAAALLPAPAHAAAA